MKPDREVFGRHDGIDVFRHTLRSRDAGIEVTVIDYGARIQSVLVPDRDGVGKEVTLGFDTLAGYVDDRDYLGATIGRCANRIDQGRFSLHRREYQLTVNNGPHHLHGGAIGFDSRLWRARLRDAAPGCDSIVFALESRGGDQGYPGTVEARVTYTVTDKDELVIEYRARASAPTPVNLTNHAYWNLNDNHRDGILDHELTLACPGYLPVDATLIPLGRVRSVVGTAMDFQSSTVIGSRIAKVPGGFDHCMVARDPASSTEDPLHIATLRSPRHGRMLRMSTTKPAIQFYTGNFLRDLPGRSGSVYQPHAGLCLESQYPPNAVNREDCPEIVLEPGDEYRHVTVYSFSVQ